LWARISSLQRESISNGNLEVVDDLESAALKIRQFIDRVRTASYGYAGFFDVIKINAEELDEVYKYDSQMVALSDEVSNAIDNMRLPMERMACRPQFEIW
jgi:glycogen synthase